MQIKCTVVGDLTKERMVYLNKKKTLKFFMDLEFDTYDTHWALDSDSHCLVSDSKRNSTINYCTVVYILFEWLHVLHFYFQILIASIMCGYSKEDWTELAEMAEVCIGRNCD